MIQRIQTLYLALTAALFIFLVSGTILTFEGDGGLYNLSVKGINEISGSEASIAVKTFIPTLLLILIPVLSVVTLFLFSNRRLQLTFTLLLTGLILIFIVTGTLSSFNFSKAADVRIVPGLKLFIPVIALLTTYMAYRYIKRDEEIVKSYDRLR